jgi:hypothetical protein
MPSRHRLSAAAHNVLHAMASGLGALRDGFLSEHLARAAARAGVAEVTLDLHAGIVTPEAAATAGLEWYAAFWRDVWPRMVTAVGADPATVHAFTITATFDHARADAVDPTLPHVVAVVARIVDDRGRTHGGHPSRSQLYLGAE